MILDFFRFMGEQSQYFALLPASRGRTKTADIFIPFFLFG